LTKAFSLGILSSPCNTRQSRRTKLNLQPELIQSPNGRTIDGCKEKSYQETRC
jgi:hypothetical protein